MPCLFVIRYVTWVGVLVNMRPFHHVFYVEPLTGFSLDSFLSRGGRWVGKLASRVVTITGEAINVDGLEQSHLVIVAQGLDRDLAQLREISNSDHAVCSVRIAFVLSNCFYRDSTISSS